MHPHRPSGRRDRTLPNRTGIGRSRMPGRCAARLFRALPGRLPFGCMGLNCGFRGARGSRGSRGVFRVPESHSPSLRVYGVVLRVLVWWRAGEAIPPAPTEDQTARTNSRIFTIASRDAAEVGSAVTKVWGWPSYLCISTVPPLAR